MAEHMFAHIANDNPAALAPVAVSTFSKPGKVNVSGDRTQLWKQRGAFVCATLSVLFRKSWHTSSRTSRSTSILSQQRRSQSSRPGCTIHAPFTVDWLPMISLTSPTRSLHRAGGRGLRPSEGGRPSVCPCTSPAADEHMLGRLLDVQLVLTVVSRSRISLTWPAEASEAQLSRSE